MKFEDIYKKIEALDEALNEAASASINMSGDNAEDVIKLMQALKGDKGIDDKPDMPDLPPMPIMGPPDPTDDMGKMRDLIKGKDDDMDMGKKDDMDDLKPGMQKEPCKICGKVHLGNSGCAEELSAEDYENEPDEKYQDQHYMTKDLSGGSEMGQKKSYPKVAGGDNPMALEDEIKAELSAQLAEKMKSDDEDDDEDMVKCPECGKEKEKLMACSSCGC
jgi:hypothetical protein